MKILNTEIKPLKPIPQVPYNRMKEFLLKHPFLHFFLHQTYCRLVLAYKKKPLSHFLKEAREIKDYKKDISDLLIVLYDFYSKHQ